MDTNEDTCQDSISEKTNHPYLQLDQEEEEEEEEEDALSFCDLPIYSSKQDQTFSSSASQSSSSDQDLFEFFTQDWTNSGVNCPVSNIIFCGKLIPFKEPNANTNKILEANKEKKAPNRGWFRWNLRIFGRKGGLSKKINGANSRCGSGPKYGFSVRRVSIVTWPAKPRWQLLMFGLARFPAAAEIGMSEIRSRQSRRSPSTLFRLSPGGDEEKVRKVRGLCGLIRSFGCGVSCRRRHRRRRHDDSSAVVKAE
ncbi:uncharacterized protein LOC130773535 [Actinidia eriantha]|uniref:uncharacterized protein LOC130773535 n=1 Tax=Actinidia eriantha TaxID=165200 RepID=UPI00258C1E29|nr:uncharacterized protein LOC130773535 [Actinidia eriantha]